MTKRAFLAVLFLSLILAACGADKEEEVPPTAVVTEAPPVPTPLPTAIPPESVDVGSWAVTFRYDFPEGFWIPGDHTFGFAISCPGQIFDYSGEWIFFRVTESATPQPFPIYLRLNGLSLEPFAPGYLDENRIHPDQQTAAVVHLVGLSDEQVEVAQEECEILVAWDRSPPQALEVSDVFEQ